MRNHLKTCSFSIWRLVLAVSWGHRWGIGLEPPQVAGLPQASSEERALGKSPVAFTDLVLEIIQYHFCISVVEAVRKRCLSLMKENRDPISWWRHVNITLYVGMYNGMAVFGEKQYATLSPGYGWREKEKECWLWIFGNVTSCMFLNLSGV